MPCYTLDDYLEVMAYNAARSYRDFVDEVVIVEDGGRRSAALLEIADTYVYHDENLGFSANVNMGWKLATKDYVFIVNSDTYIESGDAKDLCLPGIVTSPLMAGHERKGTYLNGAFFVVPRDVQRGMLNEAMNNYYSDNDYYNRVKDIFQQVDTVQFRHIYGATTKFVDPKLLTHDKKFDKIAFENIWKEEPK